MPAILPRSILVFALVFAAVPVPARITSIYKRAKEKVQDQGNNVQTIFPSAELQAYQPTKPQSSVDLYTYCTVWAGNRVFYSDVFVTHDVRRQDLFKVIPKFKQYIYNVYNVTGITTGDPMGGAGCEDGNPSRTVADRNRAKQVAATVKSKLVEAHWGDGSGSQETATADAPLSNDEAMKRAIDVEHDYSLGYCSHNATLSNAYDCTCFADKISEARQTRPGQSVSHERLFPQFGLLVRDIDIRSCFAPDRVTVYTNKRVDDVLRLNQNYLSRKDAIKACATEKVVQSLKTDEHGQNSFNRNESQYVQQCARGH